MASPPVRRAAYAAFALFCYGAFLATSAYAVGFVGSHWAVLGRRDAWLRSLDSGPSAPVLEAAVVDLALVALFGVQHSVMARSRFKAWSRRFVPAEVERSVYVLASTACLVLLFALWRPVGVTLFDVTARTLTFQPTVNFGAGTTGNAVYADSVPITGSSATMGVGSGRIVGLVKVRDDLATTYQSQLDEVARGLIATFAESDQSAVPALPDVAGLFTWSGGPALPPGTTTPGLAGSIRINAAVDPDQGGDAKLLRDGGIGGGAYLYNSGGASAYTGRLDQLLDRMNATQSFDPAAKLSSSATLNGFASSSAAWLEQARKTASDEADYRSTLLERSSDALSKVTGVNLDEEMTLMLELGVSNSDAQQIIGSVGGMSASDLVNQWDFISSQIGFVFENLVEAEGVLVWQFGGVPTLNEFTRSVPERFAYLAERLERPGKVLSKLLNLATVSLILIAQGHLLAEVRPRGFAGMLALLAASAAAGWLLGGPAPADRKTLSLTTSLRNVGVGLVIATGTFPGTPAVTAVLVYGLFEVLGSLLLALAWSRDIAGRPGRANGGRAKS